MSSDGMNYAPTSTVGGPVCEPGEFKFAAMALDHGHIYGMTAGLVNAGATLAKVYDPDTEKAQGLAEQYGAEVATSEAEILEDDSIQLVAAAAVPNLRGPLGLKVQDHGKHYFTDKTPFTEMAHLEAARAKQRETGKKWAVCYSERVQNEAAVYAGQLVHDGVIGRVIQVLGLGPHRLNADKRPEWFFKRAEYGGILCDIGSHQIEQFLYYTGNTGAKVVNAKVANYSNPQYPELEDWGDATLVGDDGATQYFRVDWFTPDGLGTWGDGRTIILGTEGYIELRKYIDVGREQSGNHVYLVTKDGEQHIPVTGKVGFPYFGQLIRDCLDGTDLAMPQDHTFLAAQLCLEAQAAATNLTPDTLTG